MKLHSCILALALAVTFAAYATAEPSAPPPEIPNGRVVFENLLSGGQPTPQHVEQAARAGFRTVINLRTPGEPGHEWEREAVERLGMRYVHLPIGGAADLTRENVLAFDALLRESLALGPVLLHCASGNRDGALLALRETWVHGVDPEQAVRFGLDAGMTRLEPKVREILGVPAAEVPR